MIAEIIQTTIQKVCGVGMGCGSIIYDGFSYRLDRTREKVMFWRCTKSYIIFHSFIPFFIGKITLYLHVFDSLK